jgi:hypothetical protein
MHGYSGSRVIKAHGFQEAFKSYQVQWLESVIWQQKKKLQRKKVLSIFSWLKVFKQSFLHSLNQNAFNCAD